MRAPCFRLFEGVDVGCREQVAEGNKRSEAGGENIGILHEDGGLKAPPDALMLPMVAAVGVGRVTLENIVSSHSLEGRVIAQFARNFKICKGMQGNEKNHGI